MLIAMKTFPAGLVVGLTMGIALGGCMAPQKELAHKRAPDADLPQLVRFFKIQQFRLKPGALFISGKGSAAADGGKNTFTAIGPFSSYPFIQMTIRSTNTDELNLCLQQLQAIKESHETIDIRGMGTFTIKSEIDPPLETGFFTLTKLDACGKSASPNAVSNASAASAIVSTTSTIISAADLVAVPERYLDHPVTISGLLVSHVQFMDPVSHLDIESESQFLSSYFMTISLPAESRLSLVHAAPGSTLILEGTWTRITPKSLSTQSGIAAKSEYEFDISRVISVTAPASLSPSTPHP